MVGHVESKDASSALAPLADKAIVRGPAALRPDERERLLDDAVQLQRLHVRAWQEWPVEAWNLPRPVHAEPPTLATGQSVLPLLDEDALPPGLPTALRTTDLEG